MGRLGTGAILESLLTTRGDTIFRDATEAARLAKGAAGTVYTMGANDPSWAAAAAQAVTREGGVTTEATTTSTSPVDLLTVSSLSIATGAHVLFGVPYRKTSGATARVGVGLKVNAVVTAEASTSTLGLGFTGSTDEAQERHSMVYLGPRVANYGGRCSTVLAHGANSNDVAVGASADVTAGIPLATITDVILRGITTSVSITLGADEFHVYSLAVS